MVRCNHCVVDDEWTAQLKRDVWSCNEPGLEGLTSGECTADMKHPCFKYPQEDGP